MKLSLKGTPLDKLFAALAVLLLAMVLFLYSGQGKGTAELAKLRKQVEGARQELQQTRRLADVEAARKRLTELRSKALAFPTASAAEEAAVSLWTWAGSSGVDLQQMGYNVTSANAGEWSYPAHSFPLTGKGTPASISDFLRRMEASPLRTVGISALQITQAPDGAWQFSFAFTVWSQATKIEKPAGGAK